MPLVAFNFKTYRFFSITKNRILLNEVPGIITTDRGLEPLLTESESAVLPLHQSASIRLFSAVLKLSSEY